MNRYFVLTFLMLVMCISVSVKPMLAQDSYSELTDPSGVTVPAPVVTENFLPLNEFVSVTDDRVEFEETCSGLSFESFENASLPPTAIVTCPQTINSSGGGFCYSPGDLIEGFSMSGIAVAGIGELVALTPPFFIGVPDIVVGPNTFLDDLRIDFDGPVNAVGLVVYAGIGPTSVDIDIYGQGNVLLGTATILPEATGSFIGISSTISIERIELIGGIGELVNDLSFGICASTVPTIGEWGMAATAGLLAIIGFIAMRRRLSLQK